MLFHYFLLRSFRRSFQGKYIFWFDYGIQKNIIDVPMMCEFINSEYFKCIRFRIW